MSAFLVCQKLLESKGDYMRFCLKCWIKAEGEPGAIATARSGMILSGWEKNHFQMRNNLFFDVSSICDQLLLSILRKGSG